MMKRLMQWCKYHFLKILLAFMVVYLLAEPFSDKIVFFESLSWIQYVILVLIFPYLLTKSKKILILSVLVAPLIVYEQLFGVSNGITKFQLARDYLVIFLNIYITGFLFYYTFRYVGPKRDRIFSSICIYLLIAISFSNIFYVVETVEPNSFEFQESLTNSSTLRKREFLYFSFITLTTLGYGDVIPLSPLAKRLTSIEACFGILYIALFVGRVISDQNRLKGKG